MDWSGSPTTTSRGRVAGGASSWSSSNCAGSTSGTRRRDEPEVALICSRSLGVDAAASIAPVMRSLKSTISVRVASILVRLVGGVRACAGARLRCLGGEEHAEGGPGFASSGDEGQHVAGECV